MHLISLEFKYSDPCPQIASEIENEIFGSSSSADSLSFTSEDHKTHKFLFKYKAYPTSKTAYSLIKRKAKNMYDKHFVVSSYDIHMDKEDVP